MTDRKKVIKDIEECLSASCRGYRPRLSCPYNDEEWDIMREALELLKERPELVQCKDCKHHGKGTCSAAAGIAYPPPDEWYCADGERRTDDALDNSKW